MPQSSGKNNGMTAAAYQQLKHLALVLCRIGIQPSEGAEHGVEGLLEVEFWGVFWGVLVGGQSKLAVAEIRG